MAALAGRLAQRDGGAAGPSHLVAAVRLHAGLPPIDPANEAEPSEPETADVPPPPVENDADARSSDRPGEQTPNADVLLDALKATLPPGLLDGARDASSGEGRRAGSVDAARGAPVGLLRRAPHPGARPAILPTLLAAVPWQRARGRKVGQPVRVRPADLRWRRRRRPAGTTVVFAVDASGSAATERLAEAKGAVEALLAEAYVRRDRVAVVAFRHGRGTVLLPPTRGLVTAKRALRDLPGGGATPLASGMTCALDLCRAVERAGERAMLVLLTDGRGNVALDGTMGRLAARDDERAAARAVRVSGARALVIDTAARPGRHAPALAAEMGAELLVMPRSGGTDWANAVSERLAE